MIFQISNYVFEMVGRLNLFDYLDAVCIGGLKKVFSNGENFHRNRESREHCKFREQLGGSAGQMVCEQINLNHGIKNMNSVFSLMQLFLKYAYTLVAWIH